MASRIIRGPIEGTVRPSVIWTGTEAIFWGGWTSAEDDIGLSGISGRGAAYDPAHDSWRRIARAPIESRGGHSAAWTGEEMLIWGGYGEMGGLADGAAYDPVRNTWRRIAQPPDDESLDFTRALDEEFEFGHFWTGSEWVLAYSEDVVKLVAYNPGSDTWKRLPDLPWSGGPQFVWTGSELIAAIYDKLWRTSPAGDEWSPVSGTPWGLPIYSPVWAGDRLVAVVTQWSSEPWSFLAERDPDSDAWTALPQPPSSATGELLWDGEHLIPFGSGLAYDVASASWWNVRMSVSERLRTDYAQVWTGREVIAWGGWVCGKCPQGAYDNGLVQTPNW